MNTAMLIIVVASAAAQPEQEAEDGGIPPWQKYCQTSVNEYSISPAQGERPFERIVNPVLIHTQPVRGNQTGENYIWVDADRRPAAISGIIVAPEIDPQGQFFDTYYVVREFHSLYDKSIVGKVGTRTWSPNGPGIQWSLVEDARLPRPGTQRLLHLQARQVASKFSAYVIGRQSGVGASSGGKVHLRLLPAPLYSYVAPEKREYLGGAVFGFCMATDLEIVLSVEARQTNDGYRWFFACAGFSDLDMHVTSNDREVWHEPPRQRGPTLPHFIYLTKGVKLP